MRVGLSSNSVLIGTKCAKKIAPMTSNNSHTYPPTSTDIPKLEPLTERIPYMQIRLLLQEGNYELIGGTLNAPIDLNTMVRNLQRS